MKMFSVYENSMTGQKVAVKQGFSWPAFFLNWIWAFVKGVNKYGVILLGVSVALMVFLLFVKEARWVTGLFLFYAGILASWIISGLKFNQWHEESLKMKGFVLKDSVMAANAASAIMLYMQKVQ